MEVCCEDLVEKSTEILKNRLYFAIANYSAFKRLKSNRNTFYVCFDEELIYRNYFHDFGPLNISCVFKFCCRISKMLQNYKGKKRIVHYTSNDPNKKTNAAFLMGAFAVVCLKMDSMDIYKLLMLTEPYKYRFFRTFPRKNSFLSHPQTFRRRSATHLHPHDSHLRLLIRSSESFTIQSVRLERLQRARIRSMRPFGKGKHELDHPPEIFGLPRTHARTFRDSSSSRLLFGILFTTRYQNCYTFKREMLRFGNFHANRHRTFRLVFRRRICAVDRNPDEFFTNRRNSTRCYSGALQGIRFVRVRIGKIGV